MNRRSSAVLAALLVALATPVAADAREWADGDVFVGLSDGKYNVYSNDGILQETLSQTAAGFAVDCAFDRSGVLHTTAFAFSRVERFIAPHPHTKLTDVPTGAGPESVVFARDGSFYVGHQTNPSSLRKFTGAGGAGPVFSPTHAATLLDLASDQKTLFYTSRSGTETSTRQVHRFDVSTGTNLPDFSNLGGTQATADLKLLPPGDGSGGLIVARTADIKRVSGTGDIVQTYDVPGEDSWFGIALDPNGQSFWAQTNSPGNVFRFNIASGAVERGPLPSAANAFGICVKGARTAAFDNAPPSIAINSPGDGATFTVGQAVNADFSCADDANGTGIASCSGTVPSGGAIDTASAGVKSFKVDARDVAGNTSSRTVSYTVVAPPPPPPPPPPPTPPTRIVITMPFFVKKSTNKFTTFTQLQVKGIPRGSLLKVACKAPKKKKCPGGKSFTKRNARGIVSLKKWLKKRLPAGTKMTVTVTKPGNFTGAVKTMTIRKRARPSFSDRCLPPGAKRPRRC